MSLSRKHYKEFARILKDNNTKYSILYALCEYFKNDNQYFDEEKFRKACYPTPELEPITIEAN